MSAAGLVFLLLILVPGVVVACLFWPPLRMAALFILMGLGELWRKTGGRG